MKQVWQSEDGELFDTKKECQEYEAEEKRLSKLTDELLHLTTGVGEYEIRDVLISLSENYDIVKKKR